MVPEIFGARREDGFSGPGRPIVTKFNLKFHLACPASLPASPARRPAQELSRGSPARLAAAWDGLLGQGSDCRPAG